MPTGVSDAAHEAISNSNVQRWVGAHIVPVHAIFLFLCEAPCSRCLQRPSVNFTATTPYDTLTPGVTITFHLVSASTTARPGTETATDAARLAAVKGRSAPRVGYCAHALHTLIRPSPQCRASGVDADAAHRAAVKGPDSLAFVDTDPAHFTSVKRPASLGQPHTDAGAARPWKQYVINDGVRIILAKKVRFAGCSSACSAGC